MQIIKIKNNKNGGLSETVSLGLGPKAQDSLSFYKQSEKKANEWTAPVRRNEVTGKGETSVFRQNHTVGFTLIEALVAISILMIAIASPMTLAQKGLSSASLSKDQMIAAFLAQDAIEAVKNIRDQIAVSQTTGDWLTGPTQDGFLSVCICPTDDRCNFDSDNLKSCTIDTTAKNWDSNSIKVSYPPVPIIKTLYNIDINNIKHFLSYDYDTNSTCTNNSPQGKCSEVSKFTRYINIRINPSGSIPPYLNEALVSVRVSWDSSLGTQKINVKDYIYNYSENL